MSSNKHKQNARKALSILIRQAKARKTISFFALSKEVETHWRMGPLLETIGWDLVGLSKPKNHVPALGALVIYKNGGLVDPDSMHDFLAVENRSRGEEGLKREQNDAFRYKHWGEVSKALGVPIAPAPVADIDAFRDAVKNSLGRGGGEGPAHEKLKMDVANNPHDYGFAFSSGKSEKDLSSGDRLDVFFESKRKVVGVEVKPDTSGEGDLKRGLFQCVKYQAVLEAEQRAFGTYKDVSTFLVLGQRLPEDLRPLANTLGVQVKEFPA